MTLETRHKKLDGRMGYNVRAMRWHVVNLIDMPNLTYEMVLRHLDGVVTRNWQDFSPRWLTLRHWELKL